MKKWMVAMMVAALCICTTACGGSSNGTDSTSNSETGKTDVVAADEENASEEDASEADVTEVEETEAEQAETQVCAVGDTVSTDQVEFQLIDFQLTDKISLEWGEDIYEPTYAPYNEEPRWTTSANDGYVIAYIKYSYRNIGKTNFSAHLDRMIFINWNGDDGYFFSGADYCRGMFVKEPNKNGSLFGLGYDVAYSLGLLAGSSSMSGYSSTELKVLTDPVYCNLCYVLPDDVVEDESTPLNLIFTLPSEEGASVRFVCSVR